MLRNNLSSWFCPDQVGHWFWHKWEGHLPGCQVSHLENASLGDWAWFGPVPVHISYPLSLFPDLKAAFLTGGNSSGISYNCVLVTDIQNVKYEHSGLFLPIVGICFCPWIHCLGWPLSAPRCDNANHQGETLTACSFCSQLGKLHWKSCYYNLLLKASKGDSS